MSWSDDTRCLFCDGKLPLYRKLAQGQFCSKAHQEAYWKEQDALAVEALHRTHDALQAYKPAVSIESILGPAPVSAPVAAPPLFVDTDPPIAGLLSQTDRIYPVRSALPSMVAGEPVEYDLTPATAIPQLEAPPVELECATQSLDLSGVPAIPVAIPIFEAVSLPALQAIEAYRAEELQLGCGQTPRLAVQPASAMPLAAAVAWQPIQAVDLQLPSGAPELLPFTTRSAAVPVHHAVPTGDSFEQLEAEAFPFVELCFPLPEPSSASGRYLQAEGGESALDFVAASPEQPLATVFLTPACEPKENVSLVALGELQPVNISSGSLPVRGGESALEFAASLPEQPRATLSSVLEYAPNASTTLFALGEFQPIAGSTAALPFDAHPADIEAGVSRVGSIHLPLATADPAHAGLQALSPFAPADQEGLLAASGENNLEMQAVSARIPNLRASAEPLAIRARAEHVFPRNLLDKVQPSAGSFKPRGPVVSIPVERDPLLPRLAVDIAGKSAAFEEARALMNAPASRQMLVAAKNFWDHAPRDLKMLLFAVPLAVGLAFHPSLPKVSLQAPDSGAKDVPGVFQRVVTDQVASVKKAIADRAAIGLDENFRQGLDSWMGNSGSTAEWSFDQAGFVQPGRVALYQPSLGLTDYELQFLGAIDKSALSWVVRASDFQNYYVVKLMIAKQGVIPQLTIVRYAVINGQPVDRVDTPVALNSRTDSLYRVAMEMKGDHYSLTIQGQVIDSWTEKRLKRGGVGFFTNRGEQSRIGWVQITHQYDALGRLFAYLAP